MKALDFLDPSVQPAAQALLAGLNPDQAAAVGAPDGHVFVLAGAGSGKTRVLTHRIAWLHQVVRVPTDQILALTFTNKAAAEMRQRANRLLEGRAFGLWAGTFHGIAHRILRLHPAQAQLPEAFQIMDSDDQNKLVKRLLKANQIDEERFPVRAVVGWIGAQKDEGHWPEQLAPKDGYGQTMLLLYQAYQDQCRRAGLVDFAELLLRVHRMFQEHPDLLAHYQRRFGHILVDEFQDTNTLQYALIRQLAGEQGKVFAVGDGDQCVIEGTWVDTPEQLVPVERLKEDDWVRTADPEGTQARITRCVRRWHEGRVVRVRAQGRTLVTTQSHTHLVVPLDDASTARWTLKARGCEVGPTQCVAGLEAWLVPAWALHDRLALLDAQGQRVPIEQVEWDTYQGWVYDLDVERAHHFVANGWMTHNCIYGWRGARMENIDKFLEEFDGAMLRRLEQNYRSSGTILQAANAVIQHNEGRLEKKLWTQRAEGAPITLYTALNEIDEAKWVVQRIAKEVAAGRPANECAILYRSNAQSRAFEEVLIAQGLPYRIYGGLRFFERLEIKDAMAYLRLSANSDDDAAFERVVNTPARGLGDKTLDLLRQRARADGSSLWESSLNALLEGQLPKRAATALSGFLGLFEAWKAKALHPLPDRVAQVLEESGLRRHHTTEGRADPDKASRLENLDELVSVASRFVQSEEEAHLNPLVGFLAHAALEAGEGQADGQTEAVQMMTLHAAKGLEFPQVFLVGLEEGLFPGQRAITDGRLDEERRLAYVGITRAEQTLALSHAQERRMHGQWTTNPLSRFVREIPVELLKKIHSSAAHNGSGYGAYASGGAGRYGYGASKAKPPAKAMPVPMNAKPVRALTQLPRPGQVVQHDQWGEGVVLRVDAQHIHIAFRGKGAKQVPREGHGLSGSVG